MMIQAIPNMREMAAANRAFLSRAVRHFEMVATVMERMPSGSYLAVTHPTPDFRRPRRWRPPRRPGSPWCRAPRPEVGEFFTGLELVDPGAASYGAGTPRRAGPARGPPGSAEQVVEVAVPDPAEEGVELGAGEHQGRAIGVAGVAHGDPAAGQPGELDAVALGTAAPALAPPRPRQIAGGHAVERSWILTLRRHRQFLRKILCGR